jgi:hypothetical protein
MMYNVHLPFYVAIDNDTVVCGNSGGQAHIEGCSATLDGGALYALAPVRFALMQQNNDVIVEGKEPGTTLAGNVAGARGGGIASWAPISVEFGYRLVYCLSVCLSVCLSGSVFLSVLRL